MKDYPLLSVIISEQKLLILTGEPATTDLRFITRYKGDIVQYVNKENDREDTRKV